MNTRINQWSRDWGISGKRSKVRRRIARIGVCCGNITQARRRRAWLDDKAVRVSTCHDEAVASGDVANPFQVPAADRDVELKQICYDTGFDRGNDHDVPQRRVNVVVDENWLALRDSHGESDIPTEGELDTLRHR